MVSFVFSTSAFRPVRDGTNAHCRWYNTTYIMVAAAALLSYIKRARAGGVSSLVRLVEMSVEILDAMDESVVARKCAEILKRHLREVDDTVNNCGAMVPFGQIGAGPGDGGETLLPSADTEFEVRMMHSTSRDGTAIPETGSKFLLTYYYFLVNRVLLLLASKFWTTPSRIWPVC